MTGDAAGNGCGLVCRQPATRVGTGRRGEKADGTITPVRAIFARIAYRPFIAWHSRLAGSADLPDLARHSCLAVFAGMTVRALQAHVSRRTSDPVLTGRAAFALDSGRALRAAIPRGTRVPCRTQQTVHTLCCDSQPKGSEALRRMRYESPCARRSKTQEARKLRCRRAAGARARVRTSRAGLPGHAVVAGGAGQAIEPCHARPAGKTIRTFGSLRTVAAWLAVRCRGAGLAVSSGQARRSPLSVLAGSAVSAVVARRPRQPRLAIDAGRAIGAVLAG